MELKAANVAGLESTKGAVYMGAADNKPPLFSNAILTRIPEYPVPRASDGVVTPVRTTRTRWFPESGRG